MFSSLQRVDEMNIFASRFYQIFSHLACDPANPECVDILKEYLIGKNVLNILVVFNVVII